MIAPDVQLVKDDIGEIRFAYSYCKAGLGISAFGAVITYFCASGIIDFWLARIIFGLSGTLITVGGLSALFNRFEISVNLPARTYRIRKGKWPIIRVTQGTLDEFKNVTLTTRNDARNSLIFRISLNIEELERPISIFESYCENSAQKKLQYWAKRLGATPVDVTNIEYERNTADKPRPVSQKAQPTAAIPISTPPGIEAINTKGVITIVLPRVEANFLNIFISILNVIFCSAFIFLSLGLIFSDPSNRSNSTPILMFHFIGILFFAVAIYSSFSITKIVWSREVLILDSTGLVSGRKIFGRVWNKVRLHRQEIKDISIKRYVGPTRDIERVTITGDRNLIRTGNMLQRYQLDWLRKLLCDEFGLSARPS